MGKCRGEREDLQSTIGGMESELTQVQDQIKALVVEQDKINCKFFSPSSFFIPIYLEPFYILCLWVC